MLSNSSNNFVHHFNMDILNLFDPELQLINIKPLIINKLKKLLNDLKKSKVQSILVLWYKKKDDHKSMHKIFYSSAKLITSDSDTN